MDIIKKIMLEEDLFPKTFADYQERDFGILFYNEENKNSYDSNHALIYKDRVKDLNAVLENITEFYRDKGIRPNIYQAVQDNGYFKENEAVLKAHGYTVRIEGPNKFMLLEAENMIKTSGELDIKIIDKWDERIATDIFIPSDEAHEIEVVKQSMKNENYKFFVAYKSGKAVAITYFHVSENDCSRFDYIVVSTEYRGKGYARELLSYATDYCRENGIKNCFQWPAHETSERITHEVGFRHLFSAEAGRAFQER